MSSLESRRDVVVGRGRCSRPSVGARQGQARQGLRRRPAPSTGSSRRARTARSRRSSTPGASCTSAARSAPSGGYSATGWRSWIPTTGAAALRSTAPPTARSSALRRSPDGTRLYVAGNFANLGNAPQGRARRGRRLDRAAAADDVLARGAADDRHGPERGRHPGVGARRRVRERRHRVGRRDGARRWKQTTRVTSRRSTSRAATSYFGFHEGFRDDLSLRLLVADATTGQIDSTFKPSFDQLLRRLGHHRRTATWLVAGGELTLVSGVPSEGLRDLPRRRRRRRLRRRLDVLRLRLRLRDGHADRLLVIAEGSSWSWRYLASAPETNWATSPTHPSGRSTGNAVLGFGSASVVTDVDTFAKPAGGPVRRTSPGPSP